MNSDGKFHFANAIENQRNFLILPPKKYYMSDKN
jgi:hypothetical protein